MPRNSSGVYSLPSGNPVITGTTITSTWANATMPDLGNEITNSLDRSGRGSMTGQLKSADGTQAAPGVTFGAETSSGFFRSGAGILGLSVLNTLVGTMTATGVAWALALGTAALPSLAFTSDPNTGIYSPGADQIGFATAGTSRGTVNATGNWSFAAPSSGLTLALTGGNGSQFQHSDGTRTGAMGVSSVDGSVFYGAASNHSLQLIANNVTRVTIGNAGNVTVAAATSGITFSVAQVAGDVGIQTVATGTSLLRSRSNTSGDAYVSVFAAGVFDYSLRTTRATSAFDVLQDATVMASWNSNRAFTINAPAAGDALTVNGVAGSNIGLFTVSASGGVADLTVSNTNSAASSDARVKLTTANGTWGIKAGRTTAELDFNSASAVSALRLTNDGRVYGTALHNNAGSVTGTTNQYVASGTYTPTLTLLANLDSATARNFQWIRVGNVVTVSGALQMDPTAGGGAATTVGISLPIASNFTGIGQVAGYGGGPTAFNGAVIEDTVNDRAQYSYLASSLSIIDHYITFTYVVL